jgi:hypothetical protein
MANSLFPLNQAMAQEAVRQGFVAGIFEMSEDYKV